MGKYRSAYLSSFSFPRDLSKPSNPPPLPSLLSLPLSPLPSPPLQTHPPSLTRRTNQPPFSNIQALSTLSIYIIVISRNIEHIQSLARVIERPLDHRKFLPHAHANHAIVYLLSLLVTLVGWGATGSFFRMSTIFVCSPSPEFLDGRGGSVCIRVRVWLSGLDGGRATFDVWGITD